MDGIKRPKSSQARTPTLQPKHRSRRSAKAVPRVYRLGLWLRKHRIKTRVASLSLALLVAFGIFFELTGILSRQADYQLSAKNNGLIGEPISGYADKLELDVSAQQYIYNKGYAPGGEVKGQSSQPKFTATFHLDSKKGTEVTDPATQTTIIFKPKFGLATPEQDHNRLVYPIHGKQAAKVITLQGSGLKEDIILDTFQGDTMRFEYEMQLPEGLEARLESNGSLAIYGPDAALLGDVQTGSEADAQLLQKARQNSKKSTLLFTLPAPFVKENGVTKSSATASFKLKGTLLTLEARNLKQATYPLSIDPSVYVESAAKFMRGNNESNIDFDTSNELIQKGTLTGARIPSWASTTALNAARWNHGTAVAGGYIYTIGGSSGSSNVSTVYWAKLDTANFSITSPNPGAGACTNWCTNTAYDLPAARAGLSVVAYNGYLYAIGGLDSGGARTTTVYYAKIGANGEPISWSSTTALGTERSYASAAVYNNRLYLMGGQTNASTGGVTTVEFASINPNGTLSSWSTTGMTVLPSARWGHTSLQYNGYLYLVGGSNGTTPQTSVHYIKIATDGSLASAWVSTTAFTTGRATFGGSFATIWGGYMYLTGGCSALSATNCTTVISSDTLKLASLNADGSLTDWTSVTGVTTTNTGYGLVGWRNTLYKIGGCTAMTTGNCTGTLTTTNYGLINNDGDVGPIESENAQPTQGAGSGQVGRTAMGVVINNGYIYNIGGCANNGCTTMSDNAGYAAINADGSIGAWSVDSTDTLNGTTGLGAFGVSVYNNTVYVVGGTSGSAYGDSVFRATFNTDGTLGAWTEQDALQAANYGHSFVITRTNNATTGNLYIMGGCTNGGTGIACSSPNYRTTVSKCTITNSTGAVSACATTNQLQLSVGTGLMAGIYYANYIYLAGGANNNGDGQTDTVYFATINSSGNIVRKDTGLATGGWDVTATLPRIRRRGVGFGVNGYVYIAGGHDGNNTPTTLSDIAYAKINQTTGQLDGFVSSTTTISQRWNQGAAAANGYAYIIGGCTTGDPPSSCSGMSGVNEKVQIYNNYSGSPASFTSSGNLFTTDRLGASSTILNGYLYVAGGCTSATDCTDATSNVQYAPLNPDGTVGTWANTTAALGGDRAFGQLENVGGTLYYIGGQIDDGTAQTTVYYGTPSSGDVTTWTAATNGLPAARTGLSASVFNNRIYATGGATGGTAQTTVYYSPSLSAGGNIGTTWTSTTAFGTARSGHVAIAYGSNLYILGGFDGTNYLMDVQYAPINSDGSVGTWNAGQMLPQPIRQADGFASNGFLYLFGGRSAATTCTNNTYVTPINAEGTIGYWSQTNVRFSTVRYGAAVAYDSGRAYILGGGCGATITYTAANRVAHTTLQFQPHIARYSIAIDTDTDVFPTRWLANGLDNSFGARWFLSYRSSTASTAAWGQTTNHGAVSLGTPGTYTPLDGSGANTNFARYYYLALSIDSQNAFGFPEDVSRGPNLYDLSLFFTSDPSKRLRHGKTFTGGEKQPLDTPFP